MKTKVWMNLVATVCFFIGIILFWWLIYYLGVEVLHFWKAYTIPSPYGVWKSAIKVISNHSLGLAILASFRRLLTGFCLAIIIGIPIGLVVVKGFLCKQFKALLLGLQTLPNVCWVPFAILWFGLGEDSVIFIVMIAATFTMALATITGIQMIQPIYLKAAKTMGASGLPLYRHIIIPAAFPTLISGLKQAWSLAWRGLLAGEMLVSTKGLGQILMMGRELSDINLVATVMIVIIIIGLFFDYLVFHPLEKKVKKKWGLI